MAQPLTAKESRVPVRLLLFGLAAVVAFALGFLAFDVVRSRILVQHYGYFTIAATFAWAAWAVGRALGGRGPDRLPVSHRERWQAAGVIMACSLVAVLTVPLNYKVLFDEAVVQATASNMHLYREVSTVMRAYWVDGVFAPFDSYLDKRPFFFPFIVSLLHDVSGYREANAFALNIVLMPVALGLVYSIGRKFARHGAAMSGVVALGCLSTLAHTATSAGLETLNLVMLLSVIHLAILYVEAPDGRRLAGLVLATVLLAQTRYESSLFVLPVAVVAFEGWRRAGRIIMPNAAIAAPLLLIPYALHNTYLSGTPSLWELREADTRFGVEYVWTNLVHAAKFLFNVHRDMTNSVWLSAAGVASTGVGVAWLWRRKSEWRTWNPAAVVLLSYGLAIAANLTILMFYYWGQLDDPTVGRLSLPFAALLSLAIAFAVGRFDAPRRRLAWLAAGGAVLAYCINGLIANAQHTRLNTLGREIEWERAYVSNLPPGERLIITNKSALPWVLRKTSAISIERARRRTAELRHHVASGTFREVLVCQLYRPTSAVGEYQIDPADRLPDWFVLEPVAERRFGTRVDRLSRLTAVLPDPAGAARSPAEAIPAAGVRSTQSGDPAGPKGREP